ncbi:uncharacterized protein LOC126849476 isoform X1 [Cataglyphis hispanica]|uniref:uncharacterized protein LOC126849476 isoform X1 n=1 Tax=Cataglyphis hispanica TaxID=1086592 RepID=UPI00217F7D91|nr:uncharacterized protein LOC126849476 isoform X1 [Cataglyphis hispanica]
MDTRTGESGGEPAATILDNNTGIATTTGPLAESSTSSSSSSSSPSASSSSPTVAPTVILTESIATNAGNLSLTGSSQSLHQVHQQQQTRQRVNLIADVAANDVAAHYYAFSDAAKNDGFRKFLFDGYHAATNFPRSPPANSLGRIYSVNARFLISQLGAPDAMTMSMTTRLRYSALINVCVYIHICVCRYARYYGRNVFALDHLY